MCDLVLFLLNPESLLLLFPHLPHSTYSQPAAAGQITVESRWSSCPSTTYHLPIIPFLFNNIPALNANLLYYHIHSRFAMAFSTAVLCFQ